ncbi:MAG: hypothetical protein V1494_04180 [Candidatus Diapherotrites archaeon]
MAKKGSRKKKDPQGAEAAAEKALAAATKYVNECIQQGKFINPNDARLTALRNIKGQNHILQQAGRLVTTVHRYNRKIQLVQARGLLKKKPIRKHRRR